jgi:hypothetical protein
MATVPDYYIDQLKEDIVSFREMLAPLKAGKMQIFSGSGNSQNHTESWIAHLERTIAMYEKIVKLKRCLAVLSCPAPLPCPFPCPPSPMARRQRLDRPFHLFTTNRNFTIPGGMSGGRLCSRSGR